jgi:hypothetical protein
LVAHFLLPERTQEKLPIRGTDFGDEGFRIYSEWLNPTSLGHEAASGRHNFSVSGERSDRGICS